MTNATLVSQSKNQAGFRGDFLGYEIPTFMIPMHSTIVLNYQTAQLIWLS